jgi:hypothetical protein
VNAIIVLIANVVGAPKEGQQGCISDFNKSSFLSSILLIVLQTGSD